MTIRNKPRAAAKAALVQLRAQFQGDDVRALAEALPHVFALLGTHTPDQARLHLVEALTLDPNPVGTANAKVGGPSTYRPVGPTCPPCSYETGCYAMQGKTFLAQKRATGMAARAWLATLIAIGHAWRGRDHVRLHVSGDFANAQQGVDEPYIEGLCLIGAYYQDWTVPQGRRRQWAWTYTHFPPEVFEPYRLRLDAAGITVLYSDHYGPGGAVIASFDSLTAMAAERPELDFFPCRNQTTGVACSACRACFTSGKKTIVFEPHGSRKRSVQMAAREVFKRSGASETADDQQQS